MKRFLPGLGLILFCALLGVLVLVSRLQPVLSGAAIHVTQTGTAYQGANRVGQMYSLTDQELELLLVTPQNSQEEVVTSFPIVFDSAARTIIRPVFISVQGTDQMRAQWADDRTLQVSLLGVVPDSYTKLVLHAPVGSFHLPIAAEFYSILLNLTFLWWLALAAIIVGMALAFGYWRIFQGRWPRPKTVQKQPPATVTPLTLAVLHHGAITATDLIGMLYDLAGRGYLQIVQHEEKQEVSFLRTSREEGLSPAERNLLIILFPEENKHMRLGAILASLDKDLFSAVVSQLYIELYQDFTERGYFRENPRSIHIRYKTAAIILQFSGLLATVLAYIFFSHTIPDLALLGLGLYVAGSMFYGLGYQFRPFSEVGRSIIQECADFQAYLQDNHAIGLEGDSGFLFYQYLPYAVVLGCIPEWRARFTGVRMYVPDWYFSQMADYMLPDQFVEETALQAKVIAHSLSAVKDPNVD